MSSFDEVKKLLWQFCVQSTACFLSFSQDLYYLYLPFLKEIERSKIWRKYILYIKNTSVTDF